MEKEEIKKEVKKVVKKKDDLLKEVQAKFPKLTAYKSLNKEQLEYLLELTTIEEAKEFVKTKDLKK